MCITYNSKCDFFNKVDGGQLCMKCSHVVRPQDCGAVQQCGEHEASLFLT